MRQSAGDGGWRHEGASPAGLPLIVSGGRRLGITLCATWLVGLALSGCGGHTRPADRSHRTGPSSANARSTAALPPAAEPAAAPGPARPPAGHSVAVGSLPEGIVADGRTGLVAVAVRGPAQIVLLSARSGRVVARVAIPGAPRHLQLAGPGGPLLVPEEPVDGLLELNLPDGHYRSIPVGAHPHDAAADHGRVFVGNEFSRSVWVLVGRRVVRQIVGFVQPGGLAAVGPAVAVVDVGADTVSLIDAGTLRVIGRLRAGAGPTHVVAGGQGRIYVIDTRGNAVLTYATRPRLRRLSQTHLPGTPYGVAIDPSHHRLWVTLTATDQLVELDTGHGPPRVTAMYATSRQPNTVAVDRSDGRVFVADAGPGTVQIVDPRR